MIKELESLSPTELEAYNLIKEKKEVAIVHLSHKLQGAVGKLKSKGLVEFFRERASFEKTNAFSGKIKIVHKRTNWVRIKGEGLK